MAKLASVWILYGYLCVLVIIPSTKAKKWSFTSLNKKSTFSAKPFLPPPKPTVTEPPRVETTTQDVRMTLKALKSKPFEHTSKKFQGSGIVLSNPGYVRENPESLYSRTREQHPSESALPQQQIGRFNRKSVVQSTNQYDQSLNSRSKDRSFNERALSDLSTNANRASQTSGGENSRQQRREPMVSGPVRQINRELNNAASNYQSQNQPQRQRQQTMTQPYSNLQIMSDQQLSSRNARINNRNQLDGVQQSRAGSSRSRNKDQMQNYPSDTQRGTRISTSNRQSSDYQQSGPQMRQFKEPYPYKKEPLRGTNELNKDGQTVIQLNPQNANKRSSNGQRGLSVSFQNLREPSYEFQPPPSQIIRKPMRLQTTVPPLPQPVPNIPSLNQLQPIKRPIKSGGFIQGQGRRQNRFEKNNYQTTPPPRLNNYATTLPPMRPQRRVNPSSQRGPHMMQRPQQRNNNNRRPQGPLRKRDRPGPPCHHTAECERGCCYTLEGEILDIDTYGPNGPKFGRAQGRCTSREPGLRERCDDLCTCQPGLECYRRYPPNYAQGEKMARNPRYEPPEVTTRPSRKCVRRAVALAERFTFWKCYFDSNCSGPLPT